MWLVISLYYQNALPTTELCSYPIFGFGKHSASVDECVQFFSAWRNSMILCFLTSLYHHAATVTMQNIFLKIDHELLMEMFTFYCHTTNIYL